MRRFPWRFVALLILTIAAGVSRFTRLNSPAIWVDEAATFRRACGTYNQMLDTLREDPFGPLFYEAEWAVRHWHALTPFWLRFVPALASALTVPAMYFLARQLVSVRTALLATTFTLCSAWMINYGRDAKMYATFWLFVVLFAGAFFCWLRTHSWTSWLAWIAAGSAMAGLNAWGVILLAMTPIWLLTARRVHWAMGPALLMGIAIVLIGPAGFYGSFNRWTEHASNDSALSNIWWLEARNDKSDALDLTKDTTAAFLFCFTYVEEGFRQEKPVPPANVLAAVTVGLTAIVGFAAFGLLPWRTHLRRHARVAADEPDVTAADPNAGAIARLIAGRPVARTTQIEPLQSSSTHASSLAEAAVIDPPADPLQSGEATPLPAWQIAPEPWWRVSLWLAMWLLVPMYVFYCMSFFEHPVSPADWIASLRDWVGPHWRAVGVWVAATAIVMSIWPIVSRIGLWLIVAGVAMTLLWATLSALHASPDPAADWQRPLLAVSRWLDLVSNIHFALPAIIVCLAAAFARSGRTWRRRVGNAVMLAMVVAAAIGLLMAVQMGCAQTILAMKQRGMHPSTLWLPRYQGFVWPAMAIAVSALLLRLPTRPLRWAAIILLLGGNLIAGSARVFGHSETPVDLMASDAKAASDSSDHTRLFVGKQFQGGPGPSAGQIDNEVGRYYLLNERTDLSPDAFNNLHLYSLSGIRHGMNAQAIANNAASRDVDRLIMWFPDRHDDHDKGPDPKLLADHVLPALGPHWRLASETSYPVRYFWCWAERYVLYRREYVRVPAEAPVSSPTPQPH